MNEFEVLRKKFGAISYRGGKWITNDGNVLEVTNKEIESYKKELEAEEVKNQIEKRATEFVKKQLDALDYDNEGEVALYAANPKSVWHDEAVKLQTWTEAVYQKMYELQESVTVDNYKEIDLDKIEVKYPIFEE